MGQAIIPFLKYLILQVVVAIVGLGVVRERKLGASGALQCWIFGQMLCLAVLQIMAVPMILLRWDFDMLFWSYLAVCGGLFGYGCRNISRRKWSIRFSRIEWNWLAVVLLIVIIALILWQAGIYFFGIHLDEDDSRFLAQANDALEYGHMLTIDWDTGKYLGWFEPIRDVTSPWTMMLAVVSRIIDTKPAIFAHTIYPPVEIFVVYGIYWLIGRELFKKKESMLSVVLLSIVVNMFFTTTVYTQSTFTLIRIWQGKASVAAVIVPLIIYLYVCLNKNNNIITWIMIAVTGCAACLMSGIGIPLSFFAVIILGTYNIVINKQWNRIPLWMLSLITPLGTGLLYIFLKG